jgi:uncharacterized protein YjbI with pentapeptide repeats
MDPTVVAAWIAAGFSVLTLAGTLTAQYLGYRATSKDAVETAEAQRKQLDRTLDEQRTRTLNERFATAAEQLGSDKPAVRLAGVYAMAGLADDWEENRQTCVDVLCAYLRMPYEPDPGQEAPELQRLAFQAIREVRHTVIRVIAAHLQEDAATSWQGLNFDFTSVVFDGGDFRRAQFSGGTVDFSDARFSGGRVGFGAARFSGATVQFFRARFSGGEVYFGAAEFSGGRVYFSGAKFSGGTVDFSHSKFSGATVDFDEAGFSGGTVSFYSAGFSGGRVVFNDAGFSGGTVDFERAGFSGGTVGLNRVRFSGGTVDFERAGFSGGTVYFYSPEFSSGTVDFSDARFSGGTVDFGGTEFSGGTVDFSDARFSGGTVDFSEAGDWSKPPKFPSTHAAPPGVKLPPGAA